MAPRGEACPEAAVRTMIIVVTLEVAQHGSGVAFVVDQEPVEEFAADRPTKRSAIAFALGARTGVLMIRMSMAVNTASKAAVNLLSRSRMRNRKRRSASSKSMTRLRACGHHAPVGCA